MVHMEMVSVWSTQSVIVYFKQSGGWSSIMTSNPIGDQLAFLRNAQHAYYPAVTS